jgi:putative tricarboxylic transport membrane protein
MSERIFGGLLLLLSIAGVYVGWGLKAPISYEPVGPSAFPVLVFGLLGICAIGLMITRRPATAWPEPKVLLRVFGLFVVVLAYAWLFDKIGFVLATTLMAIPLARKFGGSWKQALAAGIALGVGLFLIFDRVLDVALPTGMWLKPLLG